MKVGDIYRLNPDRSFHKYMHKSIKNSLVKITNIYTIYCDDISSLEVSSLKRNTSWLVYKDELKELTEFEKILYK